jgi:ketosteroid isomerase-like protein
MAWLVDNPRIPIPGQEPIQIRVTVILWRTDAGWKVAHAHVSEGVAHEV